MKRYIGYFLDHLYNDIVTHIPIHFIRIFFLRCLCKKIDKNVVVLMHTRILHPWNIVIESNVVINQYVVLDARRYKIQIGAHSDIGPYTKIWTLGHDPNDQQHSVKGADVIIGHHVWIASGVTILPGVKLGDGSVVAASSVVTKSVENNMIVAGNPAKVIKQRKNDLKYHLNYTPFFE
jgi:maltose O-acetyltransferase